jgi:hypothetical protein
MFTEESKSKKQLKLPIDNLKAINLKSKIRILKPL